MRSLTEQVTFKVSPETLAALRKRGSLQGLEPNPFARKLVEEGLDNNRSEALADELRELIGLLRPLSSKLIAPAIPQPVVATSQLAEDQLQKMTDGISQAVTQTAEEMGNLRFEMTQRLQAVNPIFDQVFALRADLNKAFAALLHLQMGFSVEDAQHWVDVRLSAKPR